MSKIVENYLLQEPIGKGVYGQVYRAIHQKSKVQFAVKVIPKSSFRSNPKLQQLTINQINILSSLKNDHIVKFYQTLKTPNNFYFVYEYCNEGTIETLIKKKKFIPEPEALIYFRQLLQAFKQLNKNNIMHRDLKPDNIFLLNGKIKLGDFGFCKMVEVNMAQSMLGSPIYMAPEILNEQIYTTKADIWSLGVVLFEMLFGYCPFESSSISELMNKLKQMDLEIPHKINPISESTEILLRKMLVKDQFKRIQWMDLFEFVIDDQGKIIAGCKKQYAIETLQRYFLNEGPQTSAHSERWSDSKKSDKNYQTVQDWNAIPDIPHNKKATSVQYLSSTTQISSPYLKKQSQKSYDFIPEKPKSQERQKFSFKHKQWHDAILLMQEWISSSKDVNESIISLVLTILLSKIEEETAKYPEWTDVLIEEKRSLKEGLSKLNRISKFPKAENQQAELVDFWRQNKVPELQKLIRTIYLVPESRTMEQVFP